MRLINKDEALKCSVMDTGIYTAINMLPAVDAIPVSWLEQHIKDAETLLWIGYASNLKSLLDTWNEVNEE